MISAGPVQTPAYRPLSLSNYRDGKIAGYIANSLSTSIGTLLERSLAMVPQAHVGKAAHPLPWSATPNAWLGAPQSETYEPHSFLVSPNAAFRKQNSCAAGLNASLYVIFYPSASPRMPPWRTILLASAADWVQGVTNLSDGIDTVSCIFLHEFGHYIDAEGRWVTDGI